MEKNAIPSLSLYEKIWLLDEVVSTATASWRIYTIAYNKFSDWPKEQQNSPEYTGYETMRVLLTHSLMSACYTFIETGKRSYSSHHAIHDPELIVTELAKTEHQKCQALRSKNATYRNNVTAHVNAQRIQSDWADFSGINNGEIDAFLKSARAIVEELGMTNLGTEFTGSDTKRFQRDFREFCRVLIE